MTNEHPVIRAVEQFGSQDIASGNFTTNALGQAILNELRSHRPFVNIVQDMFAFVGHNWSAVDRDLLGFYLRDLLTDFLTTTPHLCRENHYTRNLDPGDITSEYTAEELMQQNDRIDDPERARLIDALTETILSELAAELQDSQHRSGWVDDSRSRRTIE